MPPKARRGGAVRGRGGRGTSRGGASTSRVAATNLAEVSESSSTSTPTVVPKQEDGGDGTSGADANISATVENQSGTPVPPQTTTESASRPPRQRLDSLKSSESVSRSESPALRRGSSSRGKRPVALPSFTGRRSKEEREARNQEAQARERERNKERDAEAARKQKQKESEERRAQQRANRRGGYSGVAAGPFSMPAPRQAPRSSHRSLGGYGSGSGSRATHIKSETGGPSRKPSGVTIKKEDGGYISSSEDDQYAEFPRKDIDLIEISSDENEATVSGRGRAHLPVRIGRKEHKERVLGINTEASSEASAKILQEAEASGTAPVADAQDRPVHKGKARAKDVEITGERKPYKGMWQDPDQPGPEVKAEHISSDEEMGDAVQVGIGVSKNPEERIESPEADKKPKVRGMKEPNLQTDEERSEWRRFQSNLRHIRAELGPEGNLTGADASGNMSVAGGATNTSKATVRDNHVYLFQLPPVMPELLLPAIKKEASDQHQKAPEPTPAIKGETIVKKEEEFSNPLARIPEGSRFTSGRVGKLRVHESGKTTLDWGGTSYELTPGNPASFLQEVVSINVVTDKERSAHEDAGEAVSFGRVKGKFVVTPDFNRMFS